MRNIALEKARAEYANIEHAYIDALTGKGLVFAAPHESEERCAELRRKLAARGVAVRNAGASLSVGHLSPACVECTGANGSETFSTTFKCHRDCYFCFNRNQPDYQRFFDCGCPWEETLERCRKENPTLGCIGITGGEPLLFVDDTIELLTRAKEYYPNAHTRLYTSGDLLTEETAQRLRDAGLDEIRFSVKDDDEPDRQARVLDAMRIAKSYIPSVMVEMPVIPGAKEHMQNLLREFDSIGIDGINMLEFCFPFSNWKDFAERGFKLRNPPFEVMYDYGYSGGLAVEGSEELILELIDWALDEGIDIGMHYCSLENKHRSEIRIKNERISSKFAMMEFDEGDFFLKAAKVFGPDVGPAKKALADAGCDEIREDAEEQSITFPVSSLAALDGIMQEDGDPLTPQICYFVYECDDEGAYLIDIAIEDCIAA